MSARLVPLNSPGPSGPAISLQRPVVLIGRHPECDARIDSPQVSRRHCCIALAYDRIMIRDLGSRNGLRVNGRVVEETALSPGDELAIGQYLYRVEAVEASGARPAPSLAKKPGPASRPAPPAVDDDLDALIPLED